MRRATLLLILLVSCAHALMHMYELSLPSVELKIAATHFPDDPAQGKLVNGWMQFAWRLPLGIGGLLAGWLVDRFGSRRMLAVFLIGCGSMSFLAGFALPMPSLFTVMVAMGVFACIYHPAGLALLSHETTSADRGRALGIHGVFGSAGIGAAPFLAGFVLSICHWLEVPHGWRVYYVVLAVPGIALGLVFIGLHLAHRKRPVQDAAPAETKDDEEDPPAWDCFFLLTVIAALMGFIYCAVLSFLPRYLDQIYEELGTLGIGLGGIPRESLSPYLAGGVLLIGCLAQYIGGHIARHRVLELQFCVICFCSAPCLVWMARASGIWIVVATAMFALVHFMHQPIYNCMIAKYTPSHRRSLAYGFSFAMGLGLGSLGALFAGYNQSNLVIYQTLAAAAATAGLLSLFLWFWYRSRRARLSAEE